MRALYKRLGINAGLTTTYHPQANGQVEHKNQNYACSLAKDKMIGWIYYPQQNS